MSLAGKLTQERRARLAAERLLEQKQAELFAANQKLGAHARKLSEEIVETRAEVVNIRSENQKVKSDLSVAQEKIEIAERRLWLSIESIHDGFAFFDPDSRMIIANRAYLSVFDGLEEIGPGVSYVQILQLLTDEGIVDIGDTPPADWRAHMLERWQSPSPAAETIRLWNGEYIKLLDQRGHGGDVVSLALNITESVRSERALREARDVAESAARAKSAFLANMSHEIRTPMNGVVGMADLLMETALDEEQKLFATTIKNSGEALLIIINDVLDYSKLDADKMHLQAAPFDLETALQEVVLLLQPAVQDKPVEIAVDYDMFLPTRFLGDAGRLRQVLTNLIGNAVKFTSEGHVLVRAVGVVEGDKAQLTVTVEDTGIGISEDKLGHIFGEFNQVDDAQNRSYEGTGLGLAISQKLVEMMGGKIWVDSTVGSGSSFGFSIPLDVESEDSGSAPPDASVLGDVLLIEPSDIVAGLVSKHIASTGAAVTRCAGVEEALGLQTPLTRLIVADADTVGFDLLEALESEGCKADVLFLTGQSSAYAKEGDSGRNVYKLGKPVSRQGLFQKLRVMIDEPQDKTGGADADVISAGQDAPADMRRMKILAAEDNKTNQLVFKKMVKSLDIELVFASNGREAVELYQSFEPDLIFMDISMPEMDGKEATRAIRALEAERGEHTPIYALTAHAMNGDKEEIMQAGMDHFLTKPLRKAEIFSAIGSSQPDDTLPVTQGDEAA